MIYDGINAKCTGCKQTLFTINKDPLTISLRFNEEGSNTVNSNIIEAYRKLARRFSSDPTYEICSKKCPKCDNLSRYARDPSGKLIFICINTECRNVF